MPALPKRKAKGLPSRFQLRSATKSLRGLSPRRPCHYLGRYPRVRVKENPDAVALFNRHFMSKQSGFVNHYGEKGKDLGAAEFYFHRAETAQAFADLQLPFAWRKISSLGEPSHA